MHVIVLSCMNNGKQDLRLCFWNKCVLKTAVTGITQCYWSRCLNWFVPRESSDLDLSLTEFHFILRETWHVSVCFQSTLVKLHFIFPSVLSHILFYCCCALVLDLDLSVAISSWTWKHRTHFPLPNAVLHRLWVAYLSWACFFVCDSNQVILGFHLWSKLWCICFIRWNSVIVVVPGEKVLQWASILHADYRP